MVGIADYCGRFWVATGKRGAAPAVSDAQVIEMVWDKAKPMVGPNGQLCAPEATKRSWLIAQLRELGMTDTPALRKIQRLVRDGVFRQGPNPWPQPNDPPGIYIWMEREYKGHQDEEFLEQVRALAPDEPSAKSMRAIWRSLTSSRPVSLATVSRRLNALAAAGRVVVCPEGYYAPMPESGTPRAGGTTGEGVAP